MELVRVLKIVKIVLLTSMVYIGCCTEGLWRNYQGFDPCTVAGNVMGIERAVTLASAQSGSTAICGGFNNGEWTTFRR